MGGERTTKMSIDPRHPYAGKLVFTAFSGLTSMQSIRVFRLMKQRNKSATGSSHLPIDPAIDIGREHLFVVRNSPVRKRRSCLSHYGYFLRLKLPKCKAHNKGICGYYPKNFRRRRVRFHLRKFHKEFEKNYIEKKRTSAF